MIFGDIDPNEVSLVSGPYQLRGLFDVHRGTALDFYLNYMGSVCLFTFFVMSFSLNPFLIRHRLRTAPLSLSGWLFILLHGCDFITNLYQPLIMSLAMIRPEDVPSLLSDASVGRQLLSLPFFFAVYARYCVACGLAVTYHSAAAAAATTANNGTTDRSYLWRGLFYLYLVLVFVFCYYTVIGYGLYEPAPLLPRHSGLVQAFPINKAEDFTTVGVIRVLLLACPVVLGVVFSGLTLCNVTKCNHGNQRLLSSVRSSASGRKRIDGRERTMDAKSYRTLKLIGLLNLSGVVLILFLALSTSYHYRKMYLTFLSSLGIPCSYAGITPVLCLYDVFRKCKNEKKKKKKAGPSQFLPEKPGQSQVGQTTDKVSFKEFGRYRKCETIKEESLNASLNSPV